MSSEVAVVIKPDESGLSLLIPIISVIGIIGNVTVLVVYTKKMRSSGSSPGGAGRSLANIFIATLAFNDLVACAVVMPLTLVFEMAPSIIFTSNLSCKLYYLVVTSVIPFSAFLMTAISVDRYLCICQPLKKVLTPLRARITVIALAVTALTMGTIVAIQSVAATNDPSNAISFLETTTTGIMIQNATFHTYFRRSFDVTHMADGSTRLTFYNNATGNDDFASDITAPLPIGGCTTEPILGQTFEKYYHYIHNTITFVVALALTFIFYALIYSRIWSRHLQKASRQAATSRALQQRNAANNNNNSNSNKPQILITKPSNDASSKPAVTPDKEQCIPLVPVNSEGGGPSLDQHQPNSKNNGNDDHNSDKNKLSVISTEEQSVQSNSNQDHDTKNGDAHSSNNNSKTSSGGKQAFKITGELGTQIRLAAMLFVVTVVFTLSYVPAFLANYTSLFGDPDTDPWNRFVFYIYFVNNAANPIIYGVMNRNFREDLRQLCCGHQTGQRFYSNAPSAVSAANNRPPQASRTRSLLD